VIRTALALADQHGLDALSMRRIGQELGVEAMSLYNHVDGKEEILDGIVQIVFEEIELPTPEDAWQEGMRRRATSARQVLLRHPWARGRLEARPHNSSARRLRYFDSVLGALRGAGFSDVLAMRAFAVSDAYIYGSILQELSLPFNDDAGLQEVGTDLLRQMTEQYPHLTEVTSRVMATGYDRGAEFRAGLDIILQALERAPGA
jgi:AcrR family transcriptional regulator